MNAIHKAEARNGLWKRQKSKRREKKFDLSNFFEETRARTKSILGPGGGIGIGCGVGLGLGLVGGIGHGGSPWNHLNLAVGLGMGCGIGLGFGYGFGIGFALEFTDLNLFLEDKEPKPRRFVIEI